MIKHRIEDHFYMLKDKSTGEYVYDEVSYLHGVKFHKTNSLMFAYISGGYCLEYGAVKNRKKNFEKNYNVELEIVKIKETKIYEEVESYEDK